MQCNLLTAREYITCAARRSTRRTAPLQPIPEHPAGGRSRRPPLGCPGPVECGQKLAELVIEPPRVEAQRLSAGGGRREVAGVGLEPHHRLGQTVRALLAE